MKVFAISDLHINSDNTKPMNVFGAGWENYIEKIRVDWKAKVSQDDIVLISGDISWAMQLEEALIDLKVLVDLPGKKVFIRGNHDYWWKSLSKIRSAIYENFFVLQNDAIKFENVVICGSRGWISEGSPDFSADDKKIYLRECERLRLALHKAKALRAEGDVLVTMIHYPPFNVRRENSLFTELFEKNQVDFVVYGHLHGRDCRADRVFIKENVRYYLTACDQTDFKLVEIPVKSLAEKSL